MKPKTPIRYEPPLYLNPVETIKQKLHLLQQGRLRVIEPLGNSNSFLLKNPAADYDPTVWIVSPGASGSSLLYRNLSKKVCPYPVLKSHSYPAIWKGKDCIKAAVEGGFMWEIEKNDKVVYLYSHPLNILASYCTKLSDKPEDWRRGNQQYGQFLECDLSKDFFEVYLDEDILRLEKHLDEWWKKKNFDLLCIKYENLYECQQIIREFIEGPTYLVKGGNREIPLVLPPKRDRKHDWRKQPNKIKLMQTYASVIEKFEQKPAFELFLKESKK